MRTIATAICALFLLPLSAQEKGDTVYTFRFVPQKDMFYVPWSGNDRELARLLECVENNRQDILGGNPPPSTWTAGAIPLTSKMKTCGFAITRLSCHT